MSDERTEERLQSEGESGERGREAEPAPEAEGVLSDEELELLISASREGDVDVPVGAEGFAEAVRKLAHERDDLLGRFQRLGADYQNFQRRAKANEEEARRQARIGVVQSVVPVLDHFDLALTQSPESATAEQVIGGVRVIRDELLRVLASHGVGLLSPEPGDEFDPGRHEAVMRQPTGDVEDGRVCACFQVGYTLGDRVVRPAKVSIAEAPAGAADPSGLGGSGGQESGESDQNGEA